LGAAVDRRRDGRGAFDRPRHSAPARLLARYGRDTLEEVFLDVARGTSHEAMR